jgi:hypothetical protein
LENNLVVGLFFWVLHQAAIQLNELLQAVVALLDGRSQLLYLLVLGLHFFVEMSYLSWEISNCSKSASARLSDRKVDRTIMNELLENSRSVFCVRHVGPSPVCTTSPHSECVVGLADVIRVCQEQPIHTPSRA